MMMQSENKMFAILIPRSGFLNFFQSIFNLNQTRINMLLQYGMLKKSCKTPTPSLILKRNYFELKYRNSMLLLTYKN